MLKCLRCAEFKTRYTKVVNLKHAFIQISMKHFLTKIVFNENPVENTGLNESRGSKKPSSLQRILLYKIIGFGAGHNYTFSC